MVTFQAIKRHVIRVMTVISCLIIVGTLGYYLLGFWTGRPASVLNCFYMTVITLATVGYDEIIPAASTEMGRLFSAFLILIGAGTLFYALTSIAIMVLEGSLQGAWERWRMEKTIVHMRNHYIVCGSGRVGGTILREMVASKRPCVAIDRNARLVAELAKELKVPFIVGDATDEHTLKLANISHADGLLAALGNDHENLFIVVTARSLNPKLRVIARGNEPSVIGKMRMAGADEVILPETIGGLRMASLMIRPAAVSFLDQIMREGQQATRMRIEEVSLAEGSSLVGRRLSDVQTLQRWGALVLAYRKGDGTFYYNPPAETVLEAGMTLIVMADINKLEEMRQVAGNG